MTLTVYDMHGRVVKRLTDGTLSAGFHDVRLDMSELSGGAYLCRLTSGEYSATKQLVVMK